VRTFAEVAEWCLGAFEAYGDSSVPVCQLFFRWQPDLQNFDGRGDDETLVCGMVMGEFVLVCGPPAIIPLPVRTGEPEVTDEEVISYGAVRVVEGVWAIAPSLNLPGFIHGFVVVYGVPDPAPWERLIVLP
jgi:hypothetical protein